MPVDIVKLFEQAKMPFFQYFDAEAGVHGDRHAPCEHAAAEPVDNRGQINKQFNGWEHVLPTAESGF